MKVRTSLQASAGSSGRPPRLFHSRRSPCSGSSGVSLNAAGALQGHADAQTHFAVLTDRKKICFLFFFFQQPRRLVFALHLQAVYSPVLHTGVEVRCLLTLKDTRSETGTCMKIKTNNRTSASKRTGLMKASTNSCVRGECTDVYMLLH